MNQIVLMGRLTRDPEQKTTGSGIEYCGFTIAVNRRFANQQGVREADFIPCKAWKQTAAFVGKYFHKGDMIAISGTLQSRRYQDADGNNRVIYEVQVDNAEFCGGKRQEGASGYGEQAAPPPPPPAQMDGADDELPF